MKNIPSITPELIEYLEKLFPDKSPEPSWNDREIWMKRGAVGVVRHLRLIHEEQCSYALTGEIK